mmetsp:Transcript_1205/g.3116  ORF Transcript_1205/g.3116 Transcript_1205/m.3116 type:complete len:147 (-) Transcript_1205:1373-1813(-)
MQDKLPQRSRKQRPGNTHTNASRPEDAPTVSGVSNRTALGIKVEVRQIKVTFVWVWVWVCVCARVLGSVRTFRNLSHGSRCIDQCHSAGGILVAKLEKCRLGHLSRNGMGANIGTGCFSLVATHAFRLQLQVPLQQLRHCRSIGWR